MPLRIVSRAGTSILYLRGTVRGKAVFESTGTGDPRLAEAARIKREGELFHRALYGARSVATFAEAAAGYLETADRSPSTCGYVARLLTHFGRMRLADIDQLAVDAAYRALLRPGAAPGTKLRNVLTPLRAIMEHAAVRKLCDRPAFETPAQPQPATPFLRPAEATALVHHAAPHLAPLLVYLIGTGCRMSEALDLEWEALDLRGARAVVMQKQGTRRHVDLPPVVVAALSAVPHREGFVFRPPVRTERVAGLPQRVQPARYADTERQAGGQIGTAWASACRRAGLPGQWHEWTPRGQAKPMRKWVPAITPHDLRHTWASWDYAVHRDLLGLKKRGAWGSVASVERYAHLMPAAYVAEIEAWLNGRAVPVQAPAVAQK